MEISVHRYRATADATIGLLEIQDKFRCFVLEDTERPGQPKVFGKTAIPTGRYEVVLTYSDKFERTMPLLLKVPNFDGIRIHPGNTSADTEGCILIGHVQDTDQILESRNCFDLLYPIIASAAAKEKVFITITSSATRPNA